VVTPEDELAAEREAWEEYVDAREAWIDGSVSDAGCLAYTVIMVATLIVFGVAIFLILRA